LCDDHVILHQQTQNTNNHSLVHVDQIPEDQLPDLLKNKKIDKVEEESLHTTSHEQSSSNALQKHICCVCFNQLSKRAKTTNGGILLFCNEQCLEHYNNKKNENFDLSLIADDVIAYIMMPLIDAKVLHYLKCTNSQWKTKIEQYAAKSVAHFQFITKFGSKGSGNGQFRNPWFVFNDKQGNIYVSDSNNHRIQIFDGNGQ